MAHSDVMDKSLVKLLPIECRFEPNVMTVDSANINGSEFEIHEGKSFMKSSHVQVRIFNNQVRILSI